MSDLSETGILYTEHADLRAHTPVASLWSYETCARGPARRAVALTRDGNREYWLERTDPLLNTILPGMGVSVVVNFGDLWAAGRSLATSAVLPRVCLVGPVTQPLILRVGTHVQAIGAAFSSTRTASAFGIPPAALVNHIVALEYVWTPREVEELFDVLSSVGVRRRLSKLCRALIARLAPPYGEMVWQAAARRIKLRGGRVSIDEMANSHVLSRQEFTRRFSSAAGVPPKLFARITRFQSLVHALLASDVSRWASVAPALGFYDQAHMINEFREFAGSPPTVFFQPHDDTIRTMVQLRGRPSEWRRRSDMV